jgi:adenine-specific DNA-methyltransferase
LRPWRDKASSYCLRRTAPGALADLVGKVGCAHFFLSYNGDGQIQHETILDILGAHGEVRVLEVPYRRYKSSSRPHKGAVVTERLYHLARN